MKRIPSKKRTLRLRKIKVIFFCFYLIGVSAVKAQTKFEREYRINAEEAPKAAVTFINDAFDAQKVKWYAEESQDGKTFEAKICYLKIKHSIEFDILGHLIDVERKIKFKSLERELKNKIISTLDNLFTKHKIIKTQIQWKGNPEELLQSIKKQDKNNLPYQLYEIVVKAKKDTVFKMYEILFDINGKTQKVLEITQRPTDNLEF
ncbi:hypothetical protein [Aquimarina celericrescens]|uniref:PepSY domain-containing protein n=1 Tax=Aquimarina celericrescens TaxID=1964542 RepID=A0ABW5ATS4_9FLAO|nr:hypothetical protein [Aquimarina celericrescens]